ncbi:MAG: 4Fe-4S dicluster domain-containing protein [Desulfobacteraceae bacterium]|nr:MAG: 4Fe-4S dicluster domain-containing protein [Desulfobacteraceae bacterium]
MKRLKDRLHKVIVIGATPSGIAATNKLGELGIPVTLVDGDADLNQKLANEDWRLRSGIPFNFAHRPGLIRILRNSRINCILPARVSSIKHNQQGFSVSLTRQQTFVDGEKCILCGRCVEICPISTDPAEKAVRFNGRFSLPGRPVIDKRRLPLCRENCPLGVNAQGYIALAKAGRYPEALALIREKNILPGICGRICTHPCETACRREQLDEAVSIRAVKRFLADYEARHPENIKVPVSGAGRPECFAVIGSGPAGLAAAAQLAKHGCQVKVYDQEKMAGGLLRYGIGPHRLPRNILDAELKYIERMGVEFILSRHIDLAADLEQMQQETDGILITTGSWKDRKLGVEGEDLEGVEGCLSFLNRFYREEKIIVREKVAVIGDGNAAFDLARTLSRAGAAVTIVSWFGRDEIPADAEEVKGALEEGIAIVDRTRVIGFEGEEGRFRQLRCRPTRPGEPDAKGIAWPVVVEDSPSFALEFEKAFVAIGQTGPLMPEGGLAVNRFGYIDTDAHFRTNKEGIYAAGDSVSGPSTVVNAMARGRAAADRMLLDICDIPLPEESCRRPEEKDFPEIGSHIPIRHRTPMPEKRAVKRKDSFDEVALGLTEADILYEAQRCLQCGVCAECMQCVEACKAVGAIHHEESVEAMVEQAGVVIIADPELAPSVRGDDIIRAYGPRSSRVDIYAMLMRGFAAAAQAMVLLGSASPIQKGHGVSFLPPDPVISEPKRIGVFVCNCNRSLGWLDDMDHYVQDLKGNKDVVHAEVMASACIPEGISSIIKTVRDKGITRLVLGSCVCCSLDFACSSCTDQRSRLKHALFTATGISRSMVVTRNIRGEALSLLAKDPDQALVNFKGLLNRSMKSTRNLKTFSSPVRNYNFAAAVIGESEAAVHSAVTLARSGMDVFMFTKGNQPPEGIRGFANIHCFENADVHRLSGTLGDFKLDVHTSGFKQSLHVGTVILGEKSRKMIGYARQDSMPNRPVVCAMQTRGEPGIPQFYPGMTSIAGLFLANPPGLQISSKQKGEAAAILAAAVMPRGPRKSKGYTVFIRQELCRGCGRCAAVCPYQAVTLQANEIGGWHAWVDEAFCKGCGNCISVCPTNAADSPYRNQLFFEKTLEEILL